MRCEVVEQLPTAARKVRAQWSENDHRTPTAIDKVQDAAREIDATAAAAASPCAAAPRGVARVQIEEPVFRASDYVWWSSLGALGLLGQTSLVLFLAFFLLVYDDLFKRKLVENIGPTLGRKRITVQILNDIASQIEGFIVVQVFTSVVVASPPGLSAVGDRIEQPVGVGRRGRRVQRRSLFRPVDCRRRPRHRRLPAVRVASGGARVAGVAMLITTIEGFWLTPSLMRRVAQMNRIAIFAGILFWSWLWGVPGMLLAIPMMVVVKVVCDRDRRPAADRQHARRVGEDRARERIQLIRSERVRVHASGSGLARLANGTNEGDYSRADAGCASYARGRLRSDEGHEHAHERRHVPR